MRRMMLDVSGAGIVTDSIGSIGEFAAKVGAGAGWAGALGRGEVLDAAAVAGQDALSQLALRAVHQAWTMAGLSGVGSERVGLIVQTAWGAIDSTEAYLESMLEAEGRYASPRHFSRSVYSSVASAVAIQFHIQGPCETLAFDEGPLLGALRQAWRLLAMRRCERVVVVWCEQAGELAADLAKRAAGGLRRREFERYAERGLGFGAVALVCGVEGGLGRIALEGWEEARFVMEAGIGRPFAMDGAVGLVASVLGG